MNKVIVVGGGASGMMAAISAAKNGASVTVIERNDRVGKKILATGNGRCNYTNNILSEKNYHGSDGDFVSSGLSQFGRDQALEFFEEIGISPYIEDNKKIFPLSLQSSSVLDVLRMELENYNIELITDTFISNINKKKNEFELRDKSGRVYRSDKLIVAVGGMAMPSSGSDGNGYGLLKKLGHKSTDLYPGLVQLKLDNPYLKQINGVKIIGSASILINDKPVRTDTGDVLFTDYGISGPPILQVSRWAVIGINKGQKVEVEVNMINKSREELINYFFNRFNKLSHRSLEDSLIGFVNKKLILPILKTLNIDKNKLAGQLSKEEIYELAEIFTSWKFPVVGSKSWGNSQVTIGGIDTKDIDSHSFQSKLVKGLYIVGELMDIDGDCGGYNLQWAWTTGYIAGCNSAIS